MSRDKEVSLPNRSLHKQSKIPTRRLNTTVCSWTLTIVKSVPSSRLACSPLFNFDFDFFVFNILTLRLQEHKHPDIWSAQITFLWCFCVFPRGENGMSAVFMQLLCPSGSHSALMVYLRRFQAKRFHVAVFVQKLVSPGFWMCACQQNKSRSFSWINQPTRGSFCITEFTHLHLFFMHAAERGKKKTDTAEIV